MALGPKAMGEAIAANLKVKTGKTLEEWLALLDTQDLPDKQAATTWLKEQGLGHFQAQVVVAARAGESPYGDQAKLVSDLFSEFPEQKRLYDEVVNTVTAENAVTVNPCKGYIPLYSKEGRIAASFKPTKEGLYIGLIGESFPFPTAAHKPSLGGSERMTKGVYVKEAGTALKAVEQSLENEMKGVKNV